MEDSQRRSKKVKTRPVRDHQHLLLDINEPKIGEAIFPQNGNPAYLNYTWSTSDHLIGGIPNDGTTKILRRHET